MAIFWALVCLVLAAVNDLVFKFYARKPRSPGWFVAIVGMAWLAAAVWFPRGWPAHWGATLFWGAVSGGFSVGGNLLMLAAMRSLEAGVCATIYRLNLVPVVIGAALLLHEVLSPLQWIGIGCACLAVAAFVPWNEAERKLAWGGFVMMLAASLMRAGMGLSYRYGFLHGADCAWVVIVNSWFWIGGGALYALRRDPLMNHAADTGEEARTARRKLWQYGLLSGVLVAGIVLSMAASLAAGAASVVLPIAQMSFLLTSGLSVWLLKEKWTLLKLGALTSGVAAILLLSW